MKHRPERRSRSRANASRCFCACCCTSENEGGAGCCLLNRAASVRTVVNSKRSVIGISICSVFCRLEWTATSRSESPPRSKKLSSRPDALDPQNPLPHLGDLSVRVRSPRVRAAEALASLVEYRRRQRGPVDFSVRRKRQRLHRTNKRGNHVRREFAGKKLLHILTATTSRFPGGREVGDQPLRPVSSVCGTTQACLTVFVRAQRDLDFARLDAMTREFSPGCRCAPETRPRRPRASAPGRRCGTCARSVRQKKDRAETFPRFFADYSDSRAPRRRRPHRARRLCPAARAQILVENVNASIRDRACQSEPIPERASPCRITWQQVNVVFSVGP